MSTNTKIDIRLDRDPRYTAATAKLTELKVELDALERQRNEAEAGLSTLGSRARDQIRDEATALLSDIQAPELVKREALTKNLDDITHRLAVLRSAIIMQRQIVDNLKSEVGAAIAFDMLPQHQTNVREVIKAALELEKALQAEHGLRDRLTENGVPYTAHIRPMPLSALGLLQDDQSRVSRYLLECYEFGFVSVGNLPEIVRNRIPPKHSKAA